MKHHQLFSQTGIKTPLIGFFTKLMFGLKLLTCLLWFWCRRNNFNNYIYAYMWTSIIFTQFMNSIS